MSTLSNEQVSSILNNMTRALRYELESETVHRNCLRCSHWMDRKELCGHTAPPARPPATVIAYACSSFISDGIPF